MSKFRETVTIGGFTGRQLEQPGHDPGYVGTLGPLRRADQARLRLARRNLREIDAGDIEGSGKFLLDKRTGETMEVVTSFVDLVDPRASGVVAFCVRDSLLVPLRPLGWKNEADESHYAGEIFGRKATGRDPMPMPVDIY
jgi:hypothetical protein